MAQVIRPSLIRDGLIFYIDVENPNCRGDFSRPYSEPLTYLGQQLTYQSQPLFFQQRYNLLASVSAYKDLINNIFITTSAPALCSRESGVNYFLRFNDNKYAIENEEKIKNIFDRRNFTILLWVKNRDNNETYDKTNSIFGQLVSTTEASQIIILQNADKQIEGINGSYELQTTSPKPLYQNSSTGVKIFWDTTESSWNIGLYIDANKSYYKSYEDVDFPWDVSNWSVAISSFKFETTTPTLSILNSNNVFNFVRFDASNVKDYRTTSLNRTVINGYFDRWSMAWQTNFHGAYFYTSDNASIEPWQATSWTAWVSSLSTNSVQGHNLVDNYITLGQPGGLGQGYDSNGIKYPWLSEIYFSEQRDNPLYLNNRKRIIHITQPRSLNLTGNTILWPDGTGLNRTYTAPNATASNRFQSSFNRFERQPGGNWHIERSTNSGVTWYPWYVSNDLVVWPWQVTTWYSKVTGWDITGGFAGINSRYFTDDQLTNFNTQTNTWNYNSTDGTKSVIYKEVAGGGTSFSFDVNYPPLYRKTFNLTPFSNDGVSVYRYEPFAGSYYEIIRRSGRWFIEGYNNFNFYQSQNIDYSVTKPFDVSSWVTTVTALSVTGGGIRYTPGQPFDADTVTFINKIPSIPEEEKIYIDMFVVGCKRLGLWNTMVCWPLLSAQNASGTNDVYSLGGSGTYNGRLSGNYLQPHNLQWTSQGLFSPSSRNRITTQKQRSNYNQRTFYAVGRVNAAGYTSRARYIHSGFSEPQFMTYILAARGMCLNDTIPGLSQGCASIGYATTNPISEGLSAVGACAVPPNTLNNWATHTATLCSRVIRNYRDGSLRGTAVGGTWADNITDGDLLTLMNSQERALNAFGVDAGLIGYMAFGADFDIALTENQIKAFDFLYKLTLGRSLPVPKPTSFNNTFLLSDENQIYSEYGYSKPYWTADKLLDVSVEDLYLIFAGDPEGIQTIWGGIPTGWYYGVYDESSLGNLTFAFSADNPNIDFPWNVKEWIPFPSFTAYQAPTAVPIVLAPPTAVNRFLGLSGWVIQSTSTGSPLIASAADPTKFDVPWSPTINQWVDVNTGVTYNIGGGIVTESLNVTQNREVSAWYWQYGSSLVNGYSAESIENNPWDVTYELWHPIPGSPYFGIPAPRISQSIDTPVITTPIYNDNYLQTNPNISQLNEGSIIKRNDGILGFKFLQQAPKFSFSLGPLNTEQDWYLIGLSLSSNANNDTNTKLYKNLKTHTFTEKTTFFELSSLTMGSSNVDIGQVLVYNRPLTDLEVLKTYKSFKGRYQKDFQEVGPISEAIEEDAYRYIVKNNITSPVAQKQISDFCSEIKAADLWENIVCWPLRQNQMMPTGNIVYSLGGLGSFEGTIIGGSSRNDLGLGLTSSQYIETNFQGASGEESRSLFAILRFDNSNGFVCGEGRATLNRGFAIKYRTNLAFLDLWQFDPPNTYTPTVPRSKAIGVGYRGTSFTIWTPAVSQEVNVPSGNTLPGPFFINRANIDYNLEKQNNNYAFVLRTNTRLTKEEFDNIYSIYKNTLGRGLDLP